MTEKEILKTIRALVEKTLEADKKNQIPRQRWKWRFEEIGQALDLTCHEGDSR
jgi:hypothetical protein